MKTKGKRRRLLGALACGMILLQAGPCTANGIYNQFRDGFLSSFGGFFRR